MAYEDHAIGHDIIARYKNATLASEAHFQAANAYLPGGDTRRASFFTPYPLFMERGEGCFLYDANENRYIDMQNNYTSLIHGHAHPKVNEAAKSRLETGVVLGSAGEIQYRHAEHLCKRIASVDAVRYCNSGTEATMFAMRLARAYKKREGILKMDGGYHGMHDYAQVNIFPDPMNEGLPRAWAEPWVPRNLLKDVFIAPYNDLNRVEELLRENHDTIAAVIVEPMFSSGGMFMPDDGFIKGIRDLTKQFEVLMIMDEVMMFRLGYGGMQEMSDIRPDITALGKIIGGGFPVGAVAGRKEVMDLFSPAHSHPVFHSGTFNGNNITLAAGLAALELYDQEAVLRINILGDRLRDAFKVSLKEACVAASVTGMGSLMTVHWRKQAPRTARETFEGLLAAWDLAGLFHLEMLNRGIFSAPRGMYALTTPMTEKEVDMVADAFGETLSLLKPYIADTRPDLIIG